MKQKTHNRSWWKKRADEWFSKFIRWRDKGQCYTCKYKNDPKRLQCGHFVPRQYLATRYNEINNHAQCYACNMLFNGQPDIYAINLKRDFGNDIVEELNSLRSKIIVDMNYEEIAFIYKKKYENLISNETVLL